MQHKKHIRAKQVILYQGEATPSVQLIEHGLVKAYTPLDNGSEAIVAVFGPDDYFPISAGPSPLPVAFFYYEAMTDCTLRSMPLDEFRKDPKLSQNTKELFEKRYLGALLHINALVQLTSYEKLAHTMRYLAIRFGTDLPVKSHIRIDIKLTQQDIANLSNTSRETTNAELAKLKQSGALIVKNKLYSVNLPYLNKIIGDSVPAELRL